MNQTTHNTTTVTPIFPGAKLAVLGGGQLGRMFCVSALQRGYHVTVLDPDKNSPAGQLAQRHLCTTYDDTTALDVIATCDVVTTEFENIPLDTLRYIGEGTRLSPSPDAVAIAQDRSLEKKFARQLGLPTVPYVLLDAESDIATTVSALQFPAILKTARLGYDGKGQVVCNSVADVEAAFTSLGSVDCVLEQRVDLASEVSVVLARGYDSSIVVCPVAENRHENGILDVSIVPARVDEKLKLQAIQMATTLAQALDYVGVLAVEFFITHDNQVMINEMAPRPHNSGHYTLDATSLSQFDLQVLALCGHALPPCRLLSPVTMLNLLGDRWGNTQPDWQVLDADNNGLPQVCQHLHLYGKAEARSGRKMGHINFVAVNLDDTLNAAEHARKNLQSL